MKICTNNLFPSKLLLIYTILVSKNWISDEAPCFVGPHLDPNCLQRLFEWSSKVASSGQRVKLSIVWSARNNLGWNPIRSQNPDSITTRLYKRPIDCNEQRSMMTFLDAVPLFCKNQRYFHLYFHCKQYTVNSRYLEVVETIFYKFKLPEVQINFV